MLNGKTGFGIVLLGACLVFFAGCAHYPGGISASSTPLEGRKYSVLGRTTATDSRISLLGILPVTPANTTRNAVDEAAMKAGGDALIDVTVESYYQYWILFSRDTIRVDGMAIRFED